MTTLTLTLTTAEVQEIKSALGTAKTAMLLKDWTGEQPWAQHRYNVYNEAENALDAAIETAVVTATHRPLD